MDGWKSYWVSAGLIGIGLGLLLHGGEATWADPSGDYKAQTAKLLGPIVFALGLLGLSLRHAIRKVENELKRIKASLVVPWTSRNDPPQA